jgi:hypothetical protein
MKTKDDWNGDLGVYLQPGDEINDELFFYALGVLYPAYWDGKILCMGEASCSDSKGNPCYMTFESRFAANPEDHVYKYLGIMTLADAESLASR